MMHSLPHSDGNKNFYVTFGCSVLCTNRVINSSWSICVHPQCEKKQERETPYWNDKWTVNEKQELRIAAWLLMEARGPEIVKDFLMKPRAIILMHALPLLLTRWMKISECYRTFVKDTHLASQKIFTRTSLRVTSTGSNSTSRYTRHK